MCKSCEALINSLQVNDCILFLNEKEKARIALKKSNLAKKCTSIHAFMP